jgi:demethoxyubiquinone hydroxylase (CLK1/Coq7/Cat5 family)
MISSIQLNAVSKHSRDKSPFKKEAAKHVLRRENTDELLAGITLAGQSRISRQKEEKETSRQYEEEDSK